MLQDRPPTTHTLSSNYDCGLLLIEAAAAFAPQPSLGQRSLVAHFEGAGGASKLAAGLVEEEARDSGTGHEVLEEAPSALVSAVTKPAVRGALALPSSLPRDNTGGGGRDHANVSITES